MATELDLGPNSAYPAGIGIDDTATNRDTRDETELTGGFLGKSAY